jgi:hypothetical protein
MTTKTSTAIKVDKLDAATRQLRTAITLWFNEGDPVSIHALAFAAYEVIHAVSKKRNPYRRDLLFDSLVIKDEYRSQVNIYLKKYAYFFKHADRNPDAEIEFNPELSETFILYAICGRELCGEPSSEEESNYLWWLQIHHSDILTQKGRDALSNLMSAENIELLRRVSKHEFFKGMNDARRLTGKKMTVSLAIE